MIFADNTDQRKQKREQGQAAAFYSSYRQQPQSVLLDEGQVQACGAIG